MNTPSSAEINRTANVDPNLVTRHYKLKLMNDFMNIKYQNPKMKQSEIANQLNMSTSTIQRQRNDVNMLSPYRINPNNVKKRPKKAKIDENNDIKRGSDDLKRLQMSSNDKKTKSKNVLKAGSLQEESIEINEHYLDKVLKNNNTSI